MSETVFQVEGVPITCKGPCDHCGAEASEEDARKALRDWDDTRPKCGFCGQPIKIVAGNIRHYSSDEARPYHHWGLCQFQSEPSFNWHVLTTFTEITVHLRCAIERLPYVKWPDEALKQAGLLQEKKP